MEELRKPKTGKSCGTCRDRRIRCDRGAPACANCGRARLECQGYGLRLSWPRDGGGRRALSTPGSCNAPQPSIPHPRFFINMQQGHVAAWNDAVSSGSVHMSALHQRQNTVSYSLHQIDHSDHTRTKIMQQIVLQYQKPKTISLSLVDRDDTSLLYYYMQNAGYFLQSPLGSLPHLLLQIGLTDSSPSSVAVLNGLLAISALHVSGDVVMMRSHAGCICVEEFSC
ncbi:transcription factor [Fusarium langsethiae]|uniref:Transcription factor n=1 Tax=Fusarium langsethiae TaxID=179993 RepID=A0A0M9EPB7_FUSLA|nr:transcription factor [Fusarium langsethiae]